MPERVWLSAATGDGLDAMLSVISEFLHLDVVHGQVRLGVEQARLRALLYDKANIIDEELLAEGGWLLEVEIDRRDYKDLQQDEGLEFVVESDPLQPVIAH